MSLSRSTYYRQSNAEGRRLREQSDRALCEAIETVLADWPAYGYRRVLRELGEGSKGGVVPVMPGFVYSADPQGRFA